MLAMPIIKNHQIGDSFEAIELRDERQGNLIKSSRLRASEAPPIRTQSMPTTQAVTMEDDWATSSDTTNEPFDFEDAPDSDAFEAAPPSEDAALVIRNEFNDHFDDLTRAIHGLRDARESVIQSMQHQVVDLAMLIAEKVIQKNIEMDESIITSVVSDTLDKIAGSDRVTFKINPNDADVFNDFQPMLESRLVGVEKITIQQDSNIEQGGCVIETDLGFIDLTIKEKLTIIAQTFKKIKQHESRPL
jgi:hypothetical protein